MLDHTTIWTVTILLGIGTFFIRFSFLGFMGDRELPRWLTLHLNYVAVAVMPGLVAPLIMWPEATGGIIEAPRMTAAIVALVFGIWKRSAVWSVVSGLCALYLMLYLAH